MRSQTSLATTTSTLPTTGDESGRIPVHEQDLDLGRNGVHGLSRNGLSPAIEEYIHHR